MPIGRNDNIADPYYTEEINRIVLDKIRVCFTSAISKETYDHILLNDLDIDGFISPFTNAFYLNIKGYLAGRHAINYTIKYPKDWYNAFKERFFPAFVLKRFPVVYTEHIINGNVVLPDLKIAFPDQKQVFIVDVLKRDNQ